MHNYRMNRNEYVMQLMNFYIHHKNVCAPLINITQRFVCFQFSVHIVDAGFVIQSMTITQAMLKYETTA